MTDTARPWYRHVWPWALMLPPAASVVFWAVIITTMAGPPELVVADYTKVGLTYTQDQSARRAAADLGVRANTRIDRATGAISLRLDGVKNAPPELRLALIHATKAASDDFVELRRNSAGIYHGSTQAEILGARELRLNAPDSSWTVTGRLIGPQDTVRLAPRVRSAE